LAIGLKLINTLMDLYFNPEKTMKKAVGKESLLKGIKNFTIIPVIIAFIFGLSTVILTLMLGGTTNPVDMIMPIIGFPIGAFILVLIGTLLVNLFFWISNKLLKNKKSFTKLYYTVSVGALSILTVLIAPIVIYIIGMILTQLSVIGATVSQMFAIMGTLGLILSIIGMIILIPLAMLGHYTGWLVLKEATGLENKKLVKALIITTMVSVIVGFVILAVLGALFIQMMGITPVIA